MPPLPSPGQVVKLDFNYGNEDALATNIFYFQYSGAGPLTTAELAAFIESGVISSDLPAPYVGASVDTVGGRDSVFTDLSSPTGVVGIGAYSWEGTNTGDVLPASNSVVVSHEILRRYRGGHPRTYMMVGSATSLEGSSTKMWQGAFLTNIQDGFTAFIDSFPLTIGARTWNWVNVSYYETVDGVRTVRETPLVDLVVAPLTRARVCTQRRRLGKVGG